MTEYLSMAIAVLLVFFLLFLRSFRGRKEAGNKLHPSLSGKSTRQKAGRDQIPINTAEYQRYIAVKHSTPGYLLHLLKEHASLSRKAQYAELETMADPGPFNEREHGIASQGEWLVLRLDPQCDFYTYHNLASWFMGFPEDAESPSQSFGFARHRRDTALDYLFLLDPANLGQDTVLGAFRNGTTFSVYLPEAYEESGNMLSKPAMILGFDTTLGSLSTDGLELKQWDALTFDTHPVREYL